MSNLPLLLLCALSLLATPLLAGCATSDPAPATQPATSTTPTPNAPTTATPPLATPGPSTPAPASTPPPATSPAASTPPPATSPPASSPPPATSPAAPTYAGPAAVNLRSASGFAILGKSGISTVPASAITGDIGTSPIGSTAITGFSLVMDATNAFSTSPQVTGKVYAADYASPTPSMLTTAVGDMETAYTDAAGRVGPDATELGAGELGGRTLTPGLYKWGTNVLVTTDVTLDAQGNPNAVWILQIAQDLTVANGARVTLAGGAQAANIFWQVAGAATVGTGAHVEGNILSHTSIALKTGATLDGRALAQTAVTLDGATVTRP